MGPRGYHLQPPLTGDNCAKKKKSHSRKVHKPPASPWPDSAEATSHLPAFFLVNIKPKLKDNRKSRKGPASVYRSLEQHGKMSIKFLGYPRKHSIPRYPRQHVSQLGTHLTWAWEQDMSAWHARVSSIWVCCSAPCPAPSLQLWESGHCKTHILKLSQAGILWGASSLDFEGSQQASARD